MTEPCRFDRSSWVVRVADRASGGFAQHTVERFGRYRVVEPRIVVEIAFDVVHASKRHASGFALRFPRIVRIRDDKEAREVDRLSTVAVLHGQLQVAGRYGVLSASATSGGEGRAHERR